jgi:hypothetical protein
MMTPKSDLTRRVFLGALAAAPLISAADGWVDLFDGKSLAGWRPSENPSSWQVADGLLTAQGAPSHLFYTGPVNQAVFRNFELELEVRTRRVSASGVYFHTAFQESGLPVKGFEIQVNNVDPGEGAFRDREKTGSLRGLRGVYKLLQSEDQWFKLNALVRGKNVQIRLNGVLVVDYTEPTPPVIPSGLATGRYLDKGTFALECHDEGSRVFFRNVRVRPLPDSTPTPAGPAPVADDVYKKIVALGAQNFPVVDYHVHLKEGLTLEQALEKSRRDGVFYGLAVNCGKGFPIENDAGAQAFFESMKGQPVFIAMQAEGREWMQMFTRRAVALFDYVFTDSMTWTDNHGKRMRLWLPDEVGTIADPQEFMETLVDRATGILEHEPIDIYVNPTFLPDVLAKDYDRLWTEARMKKVVDAAARNQVAIEINSRYKLPSPAFIRLAKQAGCKFTFGTNNTSPADLGRSEYGLRMVDECSLTWRDFFVPGAWWPKAFERKGSALKAG